MIRSASNPPPFGTFVRNSLFLCGAVPSGDQGVLRAYTRPGMRTL